MPTVSRGIYKWLFQSGAVLEDLADRLSHVWTTGLLLVFACIVSWKQELNDPIRCMTPAMFSDAMVAYTHTTCWASYHYYPVLPYSKVPTDYVRTTGSWIYKWLPVVLCIQAILFKFPNIVLHVLHGYSGISFEKVASFTRGYDNLNLGDRRQMGYQTGHYLYNWCKQCKIIPWRLLSIVWLIVKILFCVNALVQFVLVDNLLTTRDPPIDNSTSYGDVIYDNLFEKNVTEWKISPIFPRTIVCTYSVRSLTNVHMYTVQCDLPANEFNEYVYMVLWMWLLVVAVTSCLSLLMWFVLTLLPWPRQRYISKMLAMTEEHGTNQPMRNNADKLAGLVGEDGVMVLKLISSNSSELFVRDVVSSMNQMDKRQSPYSYAPAVPQPSAPMAAAPQAPVQTYPIQTAAAAPPKAHLP